jgi:arylsulfatase A-like enzyme
MNVIVIVVDTLRRDAISPYNTKIDTPNLSRIAERSIVFDNLTAASCWTMPTHASMLTGEYPSTHKATRSDEGLSPSVPTVSEILRSSGYRTYCLNPPHPLNGQVGFRDRGWDRWHNTYTDPKHEQFARLLKAWIQEGLMERPRYAFDSELLRAVRTNYRTRWVLDEIIDVIDEPSDSFVFTNLFAVHRDYEPFPPGTPNVSEEARKISRREDHYQHRYNYGNPDLPDDVIDELWDLYAGGVRWVDEKLGRFFNRLEESGLDEETAVIITSDHGELFGETTDRPCVAHQNSLHPALIDVPFLLYHPNSEPRRDDRLASQVDVTPTILDVAGVLNDHQGAVGTMAGHSLLGKSKHETVFAELAAMESPDKNLEQRYEIDFSPYERTYKVARTLNYTVRFRSDGTTVAHDRQDQNASVPSDEIERLRVLVEERLEWNINSIEVSNAVRKQMERVGYLD